MARHMPPGARTVWFRYLKPEEREELAQIEAQHNRLVSELHRIRRARMSIEYKGTGRARYDLIGREETRAKRGVKHPRKQRTSYV